MMEGAQVSFEARPEQVRLGLRALKAVAMANGEFADEEQALIESAAHAFGREVDVGALEPVAPEEVAAGIDPAWRERLVQAMIVMAVIDGEATADEIAVLDRFAKALGVDEPRVNNLRQLLAGRLNLLRFDLMRRMPMPKLMLKQKYEKDGLPGVFRFLKGMIKGGGESDTEVAWRYKRLGLLPEGTLGREFWKHMTKAGFAFPGEVGGLDEVGVHHDMTHVLTGYDTDPEGETQIASFYAGYFKEDPFAFVWMVLVMFHLGIKLAPIATPGKGHFNPEKVLRAMRRGAAMKVDLTDHWNYWEVVELPIDEVRARYGIGPA